MDSYLKASISSIPVKRVAELIDLDAIKKSAKCPHLGSIEHWDPDNGSLSSRDYVVLQKLMQQAITPNANTQSVYFDLAEQPKELLITLPDSQANYRRKLYKETEAVECLLFPTANAADVAFKKPVNIADHACLPALRERIPTANYGDLRTMETKFDSEVRDALSSRFALVDEDLRQCILKEVCERLNLPERQDYILVDNKVNVYKIGGHFAAHVDTPNSRLVASVVLLPPTFDFSGGRLVVYPGEEHQRCLLADECEGNFEIAAFFPSIPHAVERVTDGTRLTLTFEVQIKDTPDAPPTKRRRVQTPYPAWQAVFEHIQDFIRLADPPEFGILLEQAYTIEPSASVLVGSDAVLFKALKHAFVGKTIRVVSVRDSRECQYSYDNDPHDHSCRIDLVTKAGMLAALHGIDNEEEEEMAMNGPMEFFESKFRRNVGCLLDEETRAIAYTGNESEPGKFEGIYFRTAVLVLCPINN
jgi:hypothetical protein